MSLVDELPDRPLTWGEARRISARLYERIDVLDVSVIHRDGQCVIAVVVVGPFDDDGVVFDAETGGWRPVDDFLGEYRELVEEKGESEVRPE